MLAGSAGLRQHCEASSRLPGLSDSSTAVGYRDRDDSGSQKSEAAPEAATPAAAPQERSSSEDGQGAEQDLLAEAGNEGVKEPSTAGRSRSRDARPLGIKTGAAAATQAGGGASAADASGNAAEASGAAAAAPEATSSGSGGGSEPATPRQESPASRRSASGSLEAVSAQSGSEAVASKDLEAPGVTGPGSDMAGLGAGESTESQQQPGQSTAEGPQPERADSGAAEGGAPGEAQPQ